MSLSTSNSRLEVDDRRASKLLSLVLRHDPGRIGVALDRAGWIDVDVLLAALGHYGQPIAPEQLARVVQTSDKQRFALDESGTRIRANQGHSVAVDLGLSPSIPPDRLFHGTPRGNLDSIMREGLLPKQRHAVHLSRDVETAHRVGARRGPHVVLVIDARAMHADGHSFTVSANGVWLVPTVPARYLSTT
jgi:putative RNA 2'-phosphotransferase